MFLKTVPTRSGGFLPVKGTLLKVFGVLTTSLLLLAGCSWSEPVKEEEKTEAPATEETEALATGEA